MSLRLNHRWMSQEGIAIPRNSAYLDGWPV